MSTLGRVVARAFEALARRTDDATALSVFRHLAGRFSVEELVVAGADGRIRGALDDRVIFPRYIRDGRWSSSMSDFVIACFDALGGGTYLDVGANIGLTTIPVARRADVACHAFEPEPRNLGFLRENVAANCSHGHVAVHGVALGETDGTATLELSSRNFGDHRLRRTGGAAGGPELHGESARQSVEVPLRRLDGVVSAPSDGGLVVKCDTQGAELGIDAGLLVPDHGPIDARDARPIGELVATAADFVRRTSGDDFLDLVVLKQPLLERLRSTTSPDAAPSR